MNSKIDFLQNTSSIKSYLSSLNPIDDKGHFEPITFNRYLIELGAGSLAKSIPALDYNNLLKFTHLQMIIYDVVSEEHLSPVKPFADVRFNKFVWAEYFRYPTWGQKIMPGYMGKQIPVDEVCKIIKDIYKVSRFGIFT
jgi:hypothetical protein